MNETDGSYLTAILNIMYQTLVTWFFYSLPVNLAFAISCYRKSALKVLFKGFLWLTPNLIASALMMFWGGYWWVRGTHALDPWQSRAMEALALVALISILIQLVIFRQHLLAITFLVLSETIWVISVYCISSMAMTGRWL